MAAIILTAAPGGCAMLEDGPVRGLENTNLETHIADDGSKRFVYTAYPSNTPGASVPADHKLLETDLRKKLRKSGFCSKGYFIYNRNFDSEKHQFMGECREGQEDK